MTNKNKNKKVFGCSLRPAWHEAPVRGFGPVSKTQAEMIRCFTFTTDKHTFHRAPLGLWSCRLSGRWHRYVGPYWPTVLHLWYNGWDQECHSLHYLQCKWSVFLWMTLEFCFYNIFHRYFVLYCVICFFLLFEHLIYVTFF